MLPRLLRSTKASASLALAAIVLLTSCAGLPDKPGTPKAGAASKLQAEQALDSLVRRQDRVYHLIAPLLVKNTPLCKTSARQLLGFTAKNRYSYPTELRAAAESRLRLGDALQVLQVLEGSGAMRAGIRRGDVLLAIEGQPLPTGAEAEMDAAKLVLPMMRDVTELAVAVSRNDTPVALKVPLTPACAFIVEIGNAPQVNAYSDGRRIMVTTGMLDALSDAELTVILAREVAHSTLRHARTMQMASTVAGVIDALLPPQPDLSTFAGSAGIKPMEPKLDQEADRFALYMLARAGFDPSTAPNTLEKLAAAYPSTVTNGYTASHPWTTKRAFLMQATLAEIRQKQLARKPLLP